MLFGIFETAQPIEKERERDLKHTESDEMPYAVVINVCVAPIYGIH